MTLQHPERRRFLKTGGSLTLLAALAATGLALPRKAFAAWNKPAFDGKTMDEAYTALGASKPATSADVQIMASDIAENGAVVPIDAVSKIPNTTQISILIDKNPNMLAALFDISPDMVPQVSTRLKMAQTSNVVVLVKADGKFYTASKEIKVTLGGCGG